MPKHGYKPKTIHNKTTRNLTRTPNISNTSYAASTPRAAMRTVVTKVPKKPRPQNNESTTNTQTVSTGNGNANRINDNNGNNNVNSNGNGNNNVSTAPSQPERNVGDTTKTRRPKSILKKENSPRTNKHVTFSVSVRTHNSHGTE
ncbi:putative uncharacterized protein DDB_G0292292 [Teleopsis dalmanni]|uniref:putative uncharacterized protein DDB_G0292292 n=1 Tax=Teleopsis dalmanni TaxID=139649 RepID=UPI0018CD391E|nr:putative uncharacterized protein DDB_G0292292 [Teleopsis dalmanni]